MRRIEAHDTGANHDQDERTEQASSEAADRAPRGEADILRLFRGDAIGSDIPGVKGTAYAMLNAVTEYVDHHATAKTDSHRMASAWLNGGDDLKTTAFEQLLLKA
jgi:hypothetical protein